MDRAMVDIYQRSDKMDAESSDISSEDDLQQQSVFGSQTHRGFHGNPHTSGHAHARVIHPQRSEEEEEDGEEEEGKGVKKRVDPGPFRYNKRVFVTALPCLLLVLAMTGETLVLMVSVGALVITLMTHMGQETDRKSVVVFALLFIPCQILVVGTVLPLVWLSVFNVVVAAIFNAFCILTGGWVILQFAAFRREEPALCRAIEQGLFAMYPSVCCALVTWVMSAVVPIAFIPFIFLFLWFVYLQLYLMPAVSSFKPTLPPVPAAGGGDEEDPSILEQPVIIAIVIVFIVSGPAVQVVLTLAGNSPLAIFTLASGVLVCELLCLGLFLSTLLSLRRLCDFMGVPHQALVQVRWGSGAGVVVLAYPALQHLGMVSHFLLSLPLAVAAFAALGLTLSLRKGKKLSALLMVVVMVLMCVWLYHLPWALTYHLLGVLPLWTFNVVVGLNFALCVLALFAAWHWTAEAFGTLLLLQSAATTVCETGLHQAGLFPRPTLQLTGIVATYTLYRLFSANKIPRNTAAMACAVQLTKTSLGALGYLRGVGKGGAVVTGVDFVTLLCFVGVLVWMFVYEAKDEVTFSEVAKDIVLLMVSMATCSRSLLIPLCQLMLQADPTTADVLGVWCGAGGALTLLYALHHGRGSGVRQQLTKVAAMMALTEALVVVTQPQFDLSLLSVYAGGEVVSVVTTGALLTWGVELRLTRTLMTAALLGLCPGLRVAWLLYGEEGTVLHFSLVVGVVCCLLAFLMVILSSHAASQSAHAFFSMGTVGVVALVAAVLAVDVVSLPPRGDPWSYPAWTLALGAALCLSLCLKALAMKLGPDHLPLTKPTEDRGVLSLPPLPVMGNVVTVGAVLLARTQGPQDALLYDLWCCASTVVLTLLQRDPVLLPSLSPSNRATPIVMAALTSLVVTALCQSRLWRWEGWLSVCAGVGEVVSVVGSLPVYAVLCGVLWCGEVWGERVVVFTVPLNAFVFLLATGYTAWALCICGFVCGVGLMAYKLPMVPYQPDPYS